MKKVGILMVLFLFAGLGSKAQETPKVMTIKIHTSAICGECKDRIEEKLNYTKGIMFAELDMETKIVEVKYKTKFLSAADVKKIISDLGYNADDVTRNGDAYSKLPRCCQDGGHDHD